MLGCRDRGLVAGHCPRAVFAWEGFGLANARDRWPTFSDVIHVITRHVVGRWVLFAVWLWLGWHFFVRGWKFFLRA